MSKDYILQRQDLQRCLRDAKDPQKRALYGRAVRLLDMNVWASSVVCISNEYGLAMTSSTMTDIGPVLDILGPLRLKALELSECPLLDCLDGLEKHATTLQWLNISGTRVRKLPKLKGSTIRIIAEGATNLEDISGLAGAKLVGNINFSGCTRLEDISALKDCEMQEGRSEGIVEVLYLSGTKVNDLEPLRGKNIVRLTLNGTDITSLDPLVGMDLVALTIDGLTKTLVNDSTFDISPLKGMKLSGLGMYGTRVKDLSPLEGMPLEMLDVDMTFVEKGFDVLTKMPKLKVINGGDPKEFFERWAPMFAVTNVRSKTSGVVVTNMPVQHHAVEK